MWLAALLLAGTPVSARTETRTTRSGDRITLANDHVEAVFRTSEAFDIEPSASTAGSCSKRAKPHPLDSLL